MQVGAPYRIEKSAPFFSLRQELRPKTCVPASETVRGTLEIDDSGTLKIARALATGERAAFLSVIGCMNKAEVLLATANLHDDLLSSESVIHGKVNDGLMVCIEYS